MKRVSPVSASEKLAAKFERCDHAAFYFSDAKDEPMRREVLDGDEHDMIVAALRSFRHAQTPADPLTRQPDLSDADRYSNNDIARRMWETFNATGNRWFKYAAQRLQGISTVSDTSTDRPVRSRVDREGGWNAGRAITNSSPDREADK